MNGFICNAQAADKIGVFPYTVYSYIDNGADVLIQHPQRWRGRIVKRSELDGAGVVTLGGLAEYGEPFQLTEYAGMSGEEMRGLFAEWCRANDEALYYVLSQANYLASRGRTFSSKYLLEKMRYETDMQLVRIVYIDAHGAEHYLKLSNDLTHFLGKLIKELLPHARITVKKSRFDEGVSNGNTTE